ncbi:MAG: hypothetical protein KY433_12735 [Actinobacteria bacterium]|nr:hypothetical protein [Actinomycetota bacterium]
MPELPEVESVRRQLEPELRGRRVEHAWYDPIPTVPREFHRLELAEGRTIETVGRRGKFLIAPLDEGLELIMHLGMTGAFRFDLDDPHVRARLELDDGRTAPARVRRLGRSRVELAIHEGRTHQVKRMLEAVGYPVRRLHRPRYAGLDVRGLREGEWRELTRDELARLRGATG